MKYLEFNVHTARTPLLMLAVAVMLIAGCGSKQQKAIDLAKTEAAKTGQPQQVVSVDKDGTTTTTVVQPPAQGQTSQALTTTTTPPVAGARPVAAADPAVSAVRPPARVSVTIPAGTNLAVRIDQTISVKTNRAGDTFTGEVVDPVFDADQNILVPKGSPVGGVVDASHKRGHFKGSSTLELRLTSLTLHGNEYPLATRDLAQNKKGKGRRSAAMIGGGAGLGMLIGGLASGGTGLLVGGLVGGGAGTAAAGLTGNKDVEIKAESIVHFKLAEGLVLHP